MRSMYYRVPDKFQTNSRGNPRGLVVLDEQTNKTIKLGWSLCHKEDEFNKSTARKFALARLAEEPIVVDYTNPTAIANAVVRLPDSIQETAKRMFYNAYMNYQRQVYLEAFTPCLSPVSSTK